MFKVFYLRVFVSLACLYLACSHIQAQTENSHFISPEGDTIHLKVEQVAKYPGGTQALSRFLNKNYRMPDYLVQNPRIEGTVYVKLVVWKNGEIRNIEILKGLAGCEPCNEEALRLVKIMPNWEPALQKGTAVNFMAICPITFKSPENVKEVVVGAQFQGGSPAQEKYIKDNLKYPARALSEKIEGKVFLTIHVDAQGKVTDVKMDKGIANCPECDAEAIRLAKEIPILYPRKKNTKPEKSQMPFTVEFKL